MTDVYGPEKRSAVMRRVKGAGTTPELVVRHWWENLLHNRRADMLKVILLMRGNRRIVVINIPWYIE